MIIKNRDELATTDLRRMALEIIEAGIAGILPSKVMNSVRYDKYQRVLTIQSDAYSVSQGRIFVIGGGKASGLMAESLENIVGTESIIDGVVICKSGKYNGSKIRIIGAGHPIPDQRGVDGVQRMLRLKKHYAMNRDDLILCLISGGGSALMPCPAAALSLDDKRRVTELLIASGANINQINIVRKHLSGTKGGRLAAFYSPTTVLSLVLSDVIGNDLSTIASGPTFPDPSTFADACNVLKSFDLLERTPWAVLELLEKGRKGLLEETPKVLDNAHNYIIGDNSLALEAMAQKANAMGLRPLIITAEQRGDTSALARLRAREILSTKNAAYNMFLIGGETTPTLPVSAGRGGRNQHYVAISMLAMEGYAGEWVVASSGTDGSDFLPDVAGAIVDNNSLANLRTQKVDVRTYLDQYDSNTLLNKLGDSIIITGDTGTNVGDVTVYILKR